MADEVVVQGGVERGVVVLQIQYTEASLFQREAARWLTDKLVEVYRQTRGQPNVSTASCIVVIQPRVAGSPLARALFELWKEVVENPSSRGGQVACVGYPKAYLDMLTVPGITDLAGFTLFDTKESALARLAPAAGV